MTERFTPEGIRAWLSDEFSLNGWHSAVVAQELSDDVLNVIRMHYTTYDKATRLGVLFSLLYIRKGELHEMRDNIKEILTLGTNDDDDWVRLTAHILNDFWSSKRFNTQIQEWSSSVQPVLDQVSQTIQSKGFSFHPIEFTILQVDARPDCPYVSDVFRSDKPTTAQHFQLSTRPGDTISSDDRMARFETILREEKMELEEAELESSTVNAGFAKFGSSPLPSPTSAVPPQPGIPGRPPAARPGVPPRSLSTGSVHGMTGMRPTPRPPGSSSLFMPRQPARRSPNASKPSFLRPSGPPRFNSMNKATAAKPDINTPRGFIKQSRVQMLDFNDATMLQESNSEAIDKAKQNLHSQQEAKKQQAAEERRKAQEERKRALAIEREERKAKSRRRSSNESGQLAPASTTTTTTTTSETSDQPMDTDEVSSSDNTKEPETKIERLLPESPNITPPPQ
ncbi:uncharacterized protein BYT42DRAFT_1149 [Radiomyces spectabilis]|uniref:uncharacterized protein n=1 Tax=Radiomyces spectabilis TaxID=64574 RepID=UPI002220DB4C|nr:uncharacterized protein BYT42DRAFT_1149 [Radiomyces spectabilis]KAI8393298.1 hypothetical protein BYT42DRAFT_1149 [Radiomyces spectabilis]